VIIIKNCKKKGYEILGVSADTEKNNHFRDKFGFPPLLAMLIKEVIDSFGVWGSRNLWVEHMMVFTELHFVIDGRYNFSCHR
jgi:peroxiredoxin